MSGEGGSTRILILTKLVFEDDPGTANAAMAILATTASDPEIQKHILNSGDLECFSFAIEKERPRDLQHRGVVALSSLTANPEICRKLTDLSNPSSSSLLLSLDRLSREKGGPLQAAADEALENLKKVGITVS